MPDFNSTTTMMEAVVQMPRAKTFLRDTLFTNIKRSSTKHVALDIVKGGRQVPPYVSWRSNGSHMKRGGFTTRIDEVPALKPYRSLDLDDLMSRLPGEGLGGRKSLQARKEELRGMDLFELDEIITRREEVQCIEAITTGKVVAVGEGISLEADFQHSDDNKIQLIGTDAWSDTVNSTPIDDLEGWADLIIKWGLTPDMALFGKNAKKLFKKNQQVVAERNMFNNPATRFKFLDLPEGARQFGEDDQSRLSLISYGETYLDDWTDPQNPVTKPAIPDNMVVILASKARYTRNYGAVMHEDSLQPVSRFPFVWKSEDGSHSSLTMQSHPLMSLDQPDAVVIAYVQ